MVCAVPCFPRARVVPWDARSPLTLFAAGGAHPNRRFLFFPRGNNTTDGSMSLYLDHVAPKEDMSWGLCLNFVLTVHSEDEGLTAIAARGTPRTITLPCCRQSACELDCHPF